MTLAEHAMDRRDQILFRFKSVTKNADDADDLFSELLLRCVRHEPSIEGDDDERTHWVQKVCGNLCVDFVRYAWVKRRSPMGVEDVWHERSENPFEGLDTALAVEALLESAPEPYRVAIAEELRGQVRADHRAMSNTRVRARKWFSQKTGGKRAFLGV